MILRCATCGCLVGKVPPFSGMNGAFDKVVVYGYCADHAENEELNRSIGRMVRQATRDKSGEVKE